MLNMLEDANSQGLQLYGSRARLGLVIPASNAVAEEEFHRKAPEGVSVHTARMRSYGYDAKAITDMMNGVVSVVDGFAGLGLKALGIAFTSGGALRGSAGEAQLSVMIENRAKVPTVSAAAALVEALKVLSVTRLAVATPYMDLQRDATRTYLEGAGFKVLKITGLGLTEGISNLPPESAYHAARDTDIAGAEAIVISATSWRTIDVIERLETELKKPVISSNTALFHALLRRAGIPDSVPGLGVLLAD